MKKTIDIDQNISRRYKVESKLSGSTLKVSFTDSHIGKTSTAYRTLNGSDRTRVEEELYRVLGCDDLVTNSALLTAMREIRAESGNKVQDFRGWLGAK